MCELFNPDPTHWNSNGDVPIIETNNLGELMEIESAMLLDIYVNGFWKGSSQKVVMDN